MDSKYLFTFFAVLFLGLAAFVPNITNNDKEQDVLALHDGERPPPQAVPFHIDPTLTPIQTATPTFTPTPEPTATPIPPTQTPIPPPPPPARAAAAPTVVVTTDNNTILQIIGGYGWDFNEAVAVAKCESGLNPNAQNPSGATGLFQIIGGNPAMFDPATNVAAAWSKYQDGLRRGNRWYHWNQFGSCGHFY